MRSCLLFAVILLLLGTNVYAILQVRSLRTEVAQLRQQVAGIRAAPAPPETLSGRAAAALEAVRRGDFGTARGHLDRIAAQVKQMRSLTERRRAELESLTKQATQALEQKRETATAAVERLLNDVRGDKEPPAKRMK